MALAVTIGVVSLIAILAVATLSLAGRLTQSSTLSVRDARLDAAVAFGLSTAMDQWRERRTGSLAIGAMISFSVDVPGVPVAVGVSVVRAGREIYWIVAEAVGVGGAVRRENLVVRVAVPDARGVLDEDSTNVTTLGFLAVDSIAAHADVSLAAGSSFTAGSGVVHVAGDATLLGGTGDGVLIVEGRLAIVGPMSFTGVIVARGGIAIGSPGVAVSGLVRAAGTPPVVGWIALTKSQAGVQDVLQQAVTPRSVKGRRWAELP